jgi:hypothetical protein
LPCQYATCRFERAVDETTHDFGSKPRAAAINRYLTLLKSGGSDHLMTLLLRAGVDLSQPETVRAVVDQLDDLVTKLEKAIGSLCLKKLEVIEASALRRHLRLCWRRAAGYASLDAGVRYPISPPPALGRGVLAGDAGLQPPSAFAPIVTASSAIAGVSFGAAKHVDDIDRLGDVDQGRIRSLPEDVGLFRVDGNDVVAGAEELLHDAIRLLVRVRRCPDDCDGRGVSEKLFQLLIRRIRVRHPLILSIVLIPALAVGCVRPARLAADLVITNARIWTGDALQPDANAVAVVGDRIVDVGSSREIDRWRAAATTVIDAEGRRVLPGFNDAHVHLIDGGTALDNVNLKDAATPAEFTRRIAERAKSKPGEWILGGEWDDQRWTPAELPTRHLIDDVTNGTPVFVTRYDGHMALANSTALGRAGVTGITPDPPGGAVVRDANGLPTGVLKDAAMEFVARVIPKMTPDARLAVVKRALRYAASVGVTSLQDMNPSYDDIAVYAELANRNELTARIYAAPLELGWYDQAKLGVHRSFGSSWLRIGAVKGYADGSLGSTTPISFSRTDAPQTRGLLSDEMQPIDDMRIRLMAADHAGLQLCMHAIGDAGISATLISTPTSSAPTAGAIAAFASSMRNTSRQRTSIGLRR